MTSHRLFNPRLLGVWVLVCSLLGAMVVSRSAVAQDYSPPPAMKAWLAATSDQGAVPAPGTVITLQNWQKYRQFMPPGMIGLFDGRFGHIKVPADFQMLVEADRPTPVSPFFIKATEQFSSQVRVVRLPDGRREISGYTAGLPFPNPSEPDKGYKVLVNNWYPYENFLYARPPTDPAAICSVDRYDNMNCSSFEVFNWRLGYNTDPGYPKDWAAAPDVYTTEYAQVLTPEQSRYTSSLTIYYKNNQRVPEFYVFLPSLRRSLRLSTAARCSPYIGSDNTQDDARTTGFNGGISLFDAVYLGRRKLLSPSEDWNFSHGEFPKDYYATIGLPRPPAAKWHVHDVDIIDIRRIPSQSKGYCYGARIAFLNVDDYYTYWVELYDANLKYWKFRYIINGIVDLPGIGRTITGMSAGTIWDVQNDHWSWGSSVSREGAGVYINESAPEAFHDFARYCTPSGLSQVMK